MTQVLWWLLALVMAPILIELLADAIPGGRLLVPAVIVLGGLRLLLVLFIGARAADHAIGRLAYDVIRLPFRLIAAAFGLALRATRADRW